MRVKFPPPQLLSRLRIQAPGPLHSFELTRGEGAAFRLDDCCDGGAGLHAPEFLRPICWPLSQQSSRAIDGISVERNEPAQVHIASLDRPAKSHRQCRGLLCTRNLHLSAEAGEHQIHHKQE